MVIEQKFKAGEEPDPTEYLFVSMEMRRADQSKPYDAKKACWVPDEKEGFVIGELKGTKGDLTTVGLPSGEVKHFLSNFKPNRGLTLFSLDYIVGQEFQERSGGASESSQV